MGIGPGNVRYNYAQLEGIWVQAGGDPQQAPLAAAVAMAESGGNSAAYGNNTNGTQDRGLWQINSSHGAASTFDIMGNARAAVSISCNGKCTNSCSLSGFTGWGNWTTYCTGAYRQFLQGAVPPDTTAPINPTGAQQNQLPQQQQGTTTGFKCSFWETAITGGICLPASAIAGAAGSQAGKAVESAGQKLAGQIIGSLVENLVDPLLEIVAGVLGMLGGGVLVIFGIWMMAKQTETYQEAKQGAGQAAGMAGFLAGPEGGAATETAAARGAAGTDRGQMARLRPPPPSRTQRAASQELNRRAAATAREKSTDELLRQEAERYR